MTDINRFFPPKLFTTDTNDSTPALMGEKTIILFYRDYEKNKLQYETFNTAFSLFLQKLPDNNVKKYVFDLYNKKLVFIGTSPSANDGIFSRVLMTNENRLAGVVLDCSDLNIDTNTGETDRIDDCIYATYFGMVRAAIIANREDVRQNKRLHRLMSTYFFLLMLKTLGKNNIYSEKQKQFLQMASIYAYYKFYLKENHSYALSIVKNEYSDIFGGEDSAVVSEFLTIMKKLKNYDAVKDIVKIFIDLNLISENPNMILISLLKNLKSTGFYSLIGSLDYFIAMAVLAKYPSELFTKMSHTTEKLHSSIEHEVGTYLAKLRCDLTAAPRKP